MIKGIMVVLVTAIMWGNVAATEYQLRKAELTAYCACAKCCGKYADGVTADGSKATQGRTLAMPRDIPFGTEVWQVTPEGNVYVGRCEDRGGAIKYKKGFMRVDVFFKTHKAALHFGRVQAILLLKVPKK